MRHAQLVTHSVVLSIAVSILLDDVAVSDNLRTPVGVMHDSSEVVTSVKRVRILKTVDLR